MNTSTASKTETAIAKHLAIDAGPVTRLLHFLLAPAPILLLLLFALFSLTSPSFLTSFNLTNVLLHASLIGLIAIGLTPVMINGQIDLTVGSILGFAACIAVGFQGALGLWGALALALASGTLLGLLNGFIIERTGVNAFIVTLAGMIGIRGLAFVVFGDTSVSPPDTQLADIGALKIGPFSLITIIFLVAALIVGAIMRLSIHGRNTYAIGGSRRAASDAGIAVGKHVIANFALCGALAALAGICMAAQLASAVPSYGRDYELWAVIAVVLGGTRMRGGRGTIAGTVVAVIALAILRNGMNLVNVSPFYVPVIIGLTLVGALVLDRKFSSKSGGAGE